MEEQIKNRISQAIRENLFPACVVGVITKDGKRLVVADGTFTYDTASRMVEVNSIFDIASITKSIPTSCLALKLIDEGKLNPEDKLIQFVPEFQNSARNEVLVKHLLTQTVPYGFRLSSYKEKAPDEILRIIFTSGLTAKPGTTFCYMNATSILLGLVVERMYGEPLDVISAKEFFEPLRMRRTGFHPLRIFEKTEAVPTEIDEWRGGVVQGTVHDESAFALQSKMVAGSAGLFATAPDLLTFLEMLLNDGTLNGKRYFSKAMVERMYTNQLSEINEWTGLGWELNQPRYMGRYCAETTFGKTGFTGCVCVCDVPRRVGVVILSNYTFPKRKPDAAAINKFRSEIADIVFENLIG